MSSVETEGVFHVDNFADMILNVQEVNDVKAEHVFDVENCADTILNV